MRAGDAQSVHCGAVKIGGSKPAVGSNVGEAHKRVHDCQLARMVELEAGSSLRPGIRRPPGRMVGSASFRS